VGLETATFKDNVAVHLIKVDENRRSRRLIFWLKLRLARARVEDRFVFLSNCKMYISKATM